MSTSSTFYTHETDLYGVSPHFCIDSNKRSLKLRNATLEDAADLLRHFSDEENVKYDASVAGLNTPEAIDDLLAQWSTFTKPLQRVNAVIVIDHRVAGTGGIGWIGTNSEGIRIGAAGIMLDSEVRGKGYAYEALRITIDYGFRVLGLDQIHLGAREENVAMRGLLDKKLGLEGKRTGKDRFGNEWEWRIGKMDWFASVHSK